MVMSQRQLDFRSDAVHVYMVHFVCGDSIISTPHLPIISSIDLLRIRFAVSDQLSRAEAFGHGFIAPFTKKQQPLYL